MIALSLRKDFGFRGISTMLELLRFLLTLLDKLNVSCIVRFYDPLRTKSGSL